MPCRPETRQALATRAHEERTLLLGLEAPLAHQIVSVLRRDHLGVARSALCGLCRASATAAGRARIEPKVACINSERFGDAGAGSSEEQRVPAATVCLLVRRVDEGVKFPSAGV